MALSENSRIVFNYVKEMQGKKDITAADIADATGIGVKQVNGIVTAAFCNKKLMQRVEAEIEQADGLHKKVKFIELTDKGMNFDPDATEE